MAFSLTDSFIASIFDATAQGEWAPFVNVIDEDVDWVINDPAENKGTLAGTFNKQKWLDEVKTTFFAKLDPNVPLKMVVESYDIIAEGGGEGAKKLKLVLEAQGTAKQRNGREYNNRYAWFLWFSPETGKIVKIREYMNTALVKEVIDSN